MAGSYDSSSGDVYSPTLTDADTATEGLTCGRERDDELLKLQMQRTWNQTRLVNLKKRLVDLREQLNAQ